MFNALLDFSREGAVFVFDSIGTDASTGGTISLKDYLTRLGAESRDPVIQQAVRSGVVPGFFFAFQVLTTIIFFSSLLSILYYLGIMQKIVMFFAKIMAYTMRVSGAEALSNSANIFVGQTEAPLVVRPYLEGMTRSELNAIMVGGFSNTAGGVLGAYILILSGYFPNIAAHLISASILSAPAGFVIAKVMVPERGQPTTLGEVKMDVPVEDVNLLDAAANGASVGMQLAINVAGMLIAFVALIAMANVLAGWFGNFFHDSNGILQFDLTLAGLFIGLMAVRRRKVSDGRMWFSLLVVAAGYAAAKTLGTDAEAARTVGLVGFALWLPIAIAALRPTAVSGRSILAGILGAFAAANAVFLIFGPLGADTKLSLQLMLGWLHWPIAFLMGTPAKDCLVVGRLLGEKIVLTELVAYSDLGGYLEASRRGLVQALDPRSTFLASYALSGFANFASIAIQIGGISPMAPSRRHEIARLGLKAMVGGAITSFMLACVAGAFYSGRSMLGL